MRKLLLPVCFALFATAAFAQRPSTLGMTCGQAAALVASAGSIVLSTGRHTYDRFVVGPQFCFLGEHAWPASAPTRDARRCRLGYTCRPGRHPFDEFFDDQFFP